MHAVKWEAESFDSMHSYMHPAGRAGQGVLGVSRFSVYRNMNQPLECDRCVQSLQLNLALILTCIHNHGKCA
jgi:hypothetical protein